MKTATCRKIPGFVASITLLGLGFSGVAAFAAASASDTAGNYIGTWGTSPANNGTGFGAWNVNVQNNSGPPYVGTYLAGPGDTPIVDGTGNAWGTYANGGPGNGSITFTRPFSADAYGATSLSDQTFSFDMGSGGVGPDQGLLSASVGTAFVFQYDGTSGGDNMQLIIDENSSLNLGAVVYTGITFSELSAGLNVSLFINTSAPTMAEGYTFTVSTFTGNNTLFTQTGTFDADAYNTSNFQFTDSDTTGNGYFNNLNISAEPAPEPSTLALMGTSGLGVLFAFRRRK